MKKVNDIRTGRHCVFLLHAHLVFVTKYRHGVFTKIIPDGLKEIFASFCRDFEAELIVNLTGKTIKFIYLSSIPQK